MNKLITILASGFGLGWSPLASGTVGSLPGIAIAWALAPLSARWQVALCAALVVLAVDDVAPAVAVVLLQVITVIVDAAAAEGGDAERQRQ